MNKKMLLIFVLLCVLLFAGVRTVQAFQDGEVAQSFIIILPEGSSRQYVVSGIPGIFEVQFSGMLFNRAVVIFYYNGQPYKDYLLSDADIINESSLELGLYFYLPNNLQAFSADVESEKKLITNKLFIPGIFK